MSSVLKNMDLNQVVHWLTLKTMKISTISRLVVWSYREYAPAMKRSSL